MSIYDYSLTYIFLGMQLYSNFKRKWKFTANSHTGQSQLPPLDAQQWQLLNNAWQEIKSEFKKNLFYQVPSLTIILNPS